MTRLDKWFGGLLLGFVILIGCFCVGWWIAFIFRLDVMLGAIAGAVFGLVADILVLWWLLPRLFDLKWIPLIFFHLLYSVFIFGFFMGVPVFIVCMGLIAGWYIGRRYHVKGADESAFSKARIRTQLWCAFVLFSACAASAYIALTDPTTAQNIQGMFSLDFKVTQGMIWGIILAGGSVLLLVQALFVRLAANVFYR